MQPTITNGSKRPVRGASLATSSSSSIRSLPNHLMHQQMQDNPTLRQTLDSFSFSCISGLSLDAGEAGLRKCCKHPGAGLESPQTLSALEGQSHIFPPRGTRPCGKYSCNISCKQTVSCTSIYHEVVNQLFVFYKLAVMEHTMEPIVYPWFIHGLSMGAITVDWPISITVVAIGYLPPRQRLPWRQISQSLQHGSSQLFNHYSKVANLTPNQSRFVMSYTMVQHMVLTFNRLIAFDLTSKL